MTEKNEKNEKCSRESGNSELTEMVFILDRSGSMSGLESDTIGGFNSLIENQKKVEGRARITTVLFDNRTETLHDGVDVEKVSPMTLKDYYVRGSTALLDAVGRTINLVVARENFKIPEEKAGKVVFVITTDGLENSSVEFTADRIRKMISHQKEEGWEFLFLGAKIDAVSTAAEYGISSDRAVTYQADSECTRMSFRSVNSVMNKVRRNITVDDSWKEEIEEYIDRNLERH